MVAVEREMMRRIQSAQSQVEPYIIDLIKGSNESNCPYKVMREGDVNSKEMRDAVTKIARMLYQSGLLNKLNLSLSNDQAYDTLLYAFGYWGGKVLYQHGSEICSCKEKCY